MSVSGPSSRSKLVQRAMRDLSFDSKRTSNVMESVPAEYLPKPRRMAPMHPDRAPAEGAEEKVYQPRHDIAKRQWVRAPVSPLNTMQTRREWFRVMQWNTMVDTDTVHSVDGRKPAMTVEEKAARALEPPGTGIERFTTPPIANVLTHPTLGELEKTWETRSRKIVDEVLHYDADVVMLNEMNRSNFNGYMWRALRSQGYGALYTSARTQRTAHQTQKDDPKQGLWRMGTQQWEGDMGNAMFYHKARFFPFFMPGVEAPSHIPYLQISGLRDRVTSHCLMACIVQFTPGEGPTAVAAREGEAAATLKTLERVMANSSDRSHASAFIAGDFNNVDYDEPCVAMMRDKFFSAFDVAGGPRWTTWYQGDRDGQWPAPRHEEPDYDRRNTNVDSFKNRDAVAAMRKRMEETAAVRRSKTSPAATEAAQADTASAAATADAAADATAATPEAAAESPAAKERRETFAAQDALEIKSALERSDKGVVKRTSDFMFFDDRVMSVLNVLDVPSDRSVDPDVLLPNARIPSHHVPLVADFCWNNFDPQDVSRSESVR
jgi:hypothetical protein